MTGELVAKALAEGWREQATAAEISPGELAKIAPLLAASGAAGLAWRRVRLCEAGRSAAAHALKNAYRLAALEAAVQERNVKEVFTLLRAEHIEPLLVKGWAAARLYPDKGLRPYADIDISIRPEQLARAMAALGRLESRDYKIDFHLGPESLDKQIPDELFARSRLAVLDAHQIRIPSPEDHLRLLCLHLLRHGVSRPLWLCDIAVALERRDADFDWELCLGKDSRRADWIACAIGLAHRLLGARIDDTPVVKRAKRLPKWFVRSVVKQWGLAYAPRSPLTIHLRNPAGAARELRRHWPNAIEATVGVKGPFNELPRFPFQFGHAVLRGGRFFFNSAAIALRRAKAESA